MFPIRILQKFTVSVLFFCLSSTATNELSQCIAPLGMETGAIKDEDITASSSFDTGNVGPQHGRVRTEVNGGAWCPQTPATAESEEWLQIDLHTVHIISNVGTQGRFGNGRGVEYSEAYMLEYWRPRLSKWIRYRTYNGEEVLKGNINTYLEAKTQLDPPIWASKVRFLPYNYHKRAVCMRVELYGCRWTEGIVSYSMPQGDKRRPNWEFYDTAYDSYCGKLRDGLGLLTDGRTGPEDFKQTFYEHSQGWVGWRNDTRESGFVEITFEFDKVRNFTAVHIFCNNQFTKEVEVFSKAYVLFSVGGRRYKGEPITFDYIEDHIFESPRNVSIKLHHRVGRFVTLQLFFASRWILISEITFDSDAVKGNFTEEDEDLQDQLLQKDQTLRPDLDNKNLVTAVGSSSSDMGQYLGVVVTGLLSVLVVLVISLVAFIIIQQRRHKNSAGQTQVQNNSEKTALYSEPNVGRLPVSSSYADVRDPEYAVPLQLHQMRPAPNLQDIFPKPPPIPPAPELNYAAIEI